MNGKVSATGYGVEPVRCVSPFFAYRVSLPALPLAIEERGRLLHFVDGLAVAALRSGQGEATLWLDTKLLHDEGGSRILSAHARSWSPEMGFCFDPTARRPRTMELSDLMDAEFGTPPRIDDRSAILISNTGKTKNAYELMSGRGLATLLFFSAEGSAQVKTAAEIYMKLTREKLRSYMAPGQFQSFAFYLPLLTAGAITGAEGKQLDMWLGNAALYVHESVEGKELVLLSRSDLGNLFRAAGLRSTSPAGGDTVWEWSFKTVV